MSVVKTDKLQGRSDPAYVELPKDFFDASVFDFMEDGQGRTTVTLLDITRAVSIKSFGGVGDDSTDNTTAITNALATGKHVYFPDDGIYRCSDFVVENSGQKLLLGKATLKAIGREVSPSEEGGFVTLQADDTGVVGGAVQGNSSEMTGAPKGGSHYSGIRFGGYKVTLEDVTVTDFVGHGVSTWSGPGPHTRMLRVVSTQNGGSGFKIDKFGSGGPPRMLLGECLAFQNGVAWSLGGQVAGFQISGGGPKPLLRNCESNNNRVGYYVSSTFGAHALNCTSNGSTVKGVWLVGGPTTFQGGSAASDSLGVHLVSKYHRFYGFDITGSITDGVLAEAGEGENSKFLNGIIFGCGNYGINAGNNTRLTVIGNEFGSNSNGNVRKLHGVGGVWKDNVGLVTRNRVRAQVTPGNTVAVAAHGIFGIEQDLSDGNDNIEVSANIVPPFPSGGPPYEDFKGMAIDNVTSEDVKIRINFPPSDTVRFLAVISHEHPFADTNPE